MTGWKAVAAARGLKLSEEDLKIVAPVMERHKKDFSVLTEAIPVELTPAFRFTPWPQDTQTKPEER
jgi:hypothetical protein